MIEFKQTISDIDYKKAIALHYFGYKYTLINPILGAILLLIIVTLVIINSEFFNGKTFFLLLVSSFLITRPLFYIQNVFKNSKSNKMFSKQTNIQITDDNKIITSIGENVSTVKLTNLYLYDNKKTFLFLYIAKNQYLILDKRQMSKTQIENLIKILNRLKIKKR